MKVSILISSIILFFSAQSFSQTTDYSDIGRNGVYAEVYILRHDFSDGFVSINYERNIGGKRRTNIRVGVYPDFQSVVSFPMTISRITKPHIHHHFEYGIGAVYRIEHYVSSYNPSKTWYHDMPALMIPLMYRYQKNKGWFFRGGINLFLSWPILPSPSFSAGYKF